MATYLFAWNPEKWNWKTLEDQINQLKINEDVYEDWSTGSRKHNIGIGDQFILVRLGTSPKGIVAIGNIASPIFEKKHWDESLAIKGKEISCVKLKIEHLDSTPLISEEELNERFPQINWTPQSNGTTIPDFIAEEIFRELDFIKFNSANENIAELEQTIINDISLLETEKQQLIFSRIGQGDFRKLLIKYWGECCITGLKFPALLIASHIKPWKNSNNYERLDIYNGLLLTPTFDKLFDQGFISFSDDGDIIYSKKIAQHLDTLNLAPNLKINLQNEHLKYMQYHRKNIFIDK